jgi:hypothetical protein
MPQIETPGSLSERDQLLCRRFLLEIYNLWPQSVPFRSTAELNFPEYRAKIEVSQN